MITVIGKIIPTHTSISLNPSFTKPLSEAYCPWNLMLSSCHSQNSLSVSSSHFIGQSFCLKGILPKCSIRQSFVLEYVFFAKLDQQIIKCKLPFRICITVSDTQQPLVNNYWMRLSILWRIMEIEEGVADNTLRDLHNSSNDTKDKFNNCFIIHSK